MKLTLPLLKEYIKQVVAEQAEKKWTSAGGLIYKTQEDFNGDTEVFVCLVAPSGGYGGYSWTFPKGRVDAGETKEKAAMREVREEAGIKARFAKMPYLGAFSGTSSITHYYVMEPVSEGGATDSETSEVRFVPLEDAYKMVNAGRDVHVLKKFEKWLEKYGED